MRREVAAAAEGGVSHSHSRFSSAQRASPISRRARRTCRFMEWLGVHSGSPCCAGMMRASVTLARMRVGERWAISAAPDALAAVVAAGGLDAVDCVEIGLHADAPCAGLGKALLARSAVEVASGRHHAASLRSVRLSRRVSIAVLIA
ncbi:hypothetical protein Saro_2701 [Novosphingobium aromaticivorans DSM 12444]|uniref:Uncharacterized protein n=1 Tax=Novosphingobium aromaticivorans (strain ATCC 700278 / DSM 12444 / CCUG 56034 / CIP 105152 / NBRC 16084 / F199) TaxID=279238 RepID=Q2G4T6_NOVAD|nr:hypothetical protein Saro_2701 [Novosphingobium aromaticivorans DSM 12444]